MLHYSWRTLNPQGKDYTYFSPLHQKYSRIDYFFISQPDIPLLQKATIEPTTLSDHHPITILLTFPKKITRRKTWRLNPSLFKDPVDIERFSQRHHRHNMPELVVSTQMCHLGGIHKNCFQNQKRTPTKNVIAHDPHTCVRSDPQVKLSNLYLSRTDPDKTGTIQDFLSKYGAPPISTETYSKLNGPVSEEEFEKVLKDMKVGKAPGPDGLLLQYYKIFKDILKPCFLSGFRSFNSDPHTSPQFFEAHIAVIPKEGKDATQVTNCRPISLINLDVKIYAKILTNC